MKSLKEKLEKMFMAIAFAEAGEHATAASLAGVEMQSYRAASLIKNIRNSFAAVAFAEEGCPDTALELLGKRECRFEKAPLEMFLEAVGLQGVRVQYGMVTVG